MTDCVQLTATHPDPREDRSADSPHWPLIGPGDPPPFTIHNPVGKAPFLLVCDHASRAFPRALGQLGVADWVLERHVAWDIGSADLCRALSDRFDAPAVMAGYSRLVVDLNRQLHDPSAFIAVSDGIAIPGNLELSEDDRRARVESFFAPYHGAVAQRLDAFRSRGHVPALVSIHTCTPVFNRVVRQWHIGVMWDRDPRIAQPLIEHLNAVEGVCVGDNEPYSGRHPNDYTVDVHAEQPGLPCVGVEVRQDLVDHPGGVERWAGILGDALDAVLSDPGLYRLRDTA